jgi:hypothetical protein
MRFKFYSRIINIVSVKAIFSRKFDINIFGKMNSVIILIPRKNEKLKIRNTLWKKG